MKFKLHGNIIGCCLILSSCVGYDVPPRIFSKKPFTLIRGGEQIGRDQLTNRLLAANKILPLVHKSSNEILSLLGQPQEIRKLSDPAACEWMYLYYRVTPFSQADGVLNVKFYNDEVVTVEKKKTTDA